MSRQPNHRPVPAVAPMIAALLVMVLGLAACAMDPVPGTYEGGDDDFTITLVVESGRLVSEVSYRVTCDGTTVEDEATLRPPYLVERGHLDLPVEELTLTGQFERDGTYARGGWRYGDCSGRWEADRISG
jgi:hypothetical protein